MGDGRGNEAYPQVASLFYLSATHVENPGIFQARYYNDTSYSCTQVDLFDFNCADTPVPCITSLQCMDFK
ncbi:hypothetical protein COCCADRAFT_87889 [Bipolaris zeicola 26-R-13]|uniref:Uncharacterized protein n=1 Tax=Cochliobolus carbonum (strain 26-R-13) TaxID=930089 RepID=W6YLL6_COCC2|nr:uncharacterized protein COCCADRAFT_87889 [Bipolaris zeicola 26-R-13]EUC36574.1 hypothetical protein COCCADRAFT_87889 [Bipolaris zeicola 26-R-13]